MTRTLPLALVLAALLACGGDDPTGIDELTDVAGRSFELVGIGHIYGYHDIVPGSLYTGVCPGHPQLREEKEFRSGELSFTDDSYVMTTRVRSHCYDPADEVIVPDWSAERTEEMSGGYTLEDDRLLLDDSPASVTVYAYLHNGGLRVEFEPTTGDVDSGDVLYFR